MADLNAADVFGGDQIIEKLIEDLDAVFPHYLPTPTDSLALIQHKAGQRSVVEYLKTLIEN